MRHLWVAALACCLAGGVEAAQHVHRPAAQTAAEIIERNAVARGGLDTWRKLNTMVWLGHLERGDAESQKMKFVMELRRPNATRFEIKSKTEQFARIFDGKHGWKVRPGKDGRPEPKAFSPEEIAFSQDEFVIDGPLLDSTAKGVAAKFQGIDRLEGRNAYRLALTLPSGASREVWIDTLTNLELRYDRPSTSPLSPGARVSIYYRDYRAEGGVQIPHRIEVAAARGRGAAEVADKLVIDRVLVNPTLDDEAFAPPLVPRARGGRVVVPAEAPMTPAPVGQTPR